jgi:hypothetical protein
MPGTARQTAFRKSEYGMNGTHRAGRPIDTRRGYSRFAQWRAE